MNKQLQQVKMELDKFLALNYNNDFIKDDPISIPHRFILQQDIEISAFFASMFAWGQRVTIINKTNELMQLMEQAPYQFILQHEDKDLHRFKDFKHRTFNYTDLLYFIDFMKRHYQQHNSLEQAFLLRQKTKMYSMENALIAFEEYFFDVDYAPARTRKHIATPARNSTCKRLNMFLRWMVRKDEKAVDFGLWKQLKPAHLLCPLDVHVERVARKYKLIERKQSDWQTVLELSKNLSVLDPKDPIKYDFALFGMGLQQKDIFL